MLLELAVLPSANLTLFLDDDVQVLLAARLVRHGSSISVLLLELVEI